MHAGSIPARASTLHHRAGMWIGYAALAQLVEHIIRNDGVTGSSPVSGTSLKKTSVFQSFGMPSKPKCHTQVSHTAQGKSELTLGNRRALDDPHCRTEVYHRRFPGVWRRGSIYQFRMRVPHDVRESVGRSHLSRSLKTDSLTVANRLAAQCSLEAAASFSRVPQTSTVALLTGIADQPNQSASLTFEGLCSRYLDDPTASRTSKSVNAYTTRAPRTHYSSENSLP